LFKHMLRKILGSVMDSKHRGYRHSSSGMKRQHGRRYSSDDRSGYGHKQQGQGYYKNRYSRSSS
jgi:hypothetical protein